jgi:ATP-dependent helicase/nuclease subunit B
MDVLLPEPITAALASGITILTGNQRAARTLHQRFDLHNRARKLTHWEPPAILAWDAWTAMLWRSLILSGHTTKLLLNRTQEHILWRALIAADPEATSLRSVDSLAELAADAFARLCNYRGESRLRSAGVSADTRAFQRWATAFDRRCRAADYLSQSQLEATLTTAIAARQITLAPSGYLLTGFDGTTPAQQALIETVRTITPITELPSAQKDQTLLATAATEHEELHTAARWMRYHLEQHPAARIALIVPALADHRAQIDRVLRQTLAPELEDISAITAPPYEFSLGIPLAETAIVATALDLLRWATHPLPLERISALLLSPYFAGGTETNARAEFDAYELRRIRTLRPELALELTLRAAESAKRAARLPRLIAALKAMRRAITEEAFATGEARPAADWADAIRALLEAAGWSANADDSIEFQTRRKWESLLDELATLDFEGVRLTFTDTLEAVQRLASQTLFAPESRNASVQVMSPLESAGSTFDALWFLHAGDLNWPQRPGTSPLLAWQLQRELHMPGADPAEDAAHARRITERIASSAPTAVFSYAAESPEGHQRPSSTLGTFALQPFEAPATEAPPQPIALEVIDDSTTLPPLPDEIISGGATILKLQAACGFRAFAEQRLWSTALDTTEIGMDARERGSTVHIVLQNFWNEVHDQPTLQSLTTEARQTILREAIKAALHKVAAPANSGWDTAYLEVQSERLIKLLDPWLITEMARQVPFLVRQSETELTDVHIGPLRLTLRVDRIDETEFGDVILDYKTGDARAAGWLTDRPDEPQLPLYAVLAGSPRLAGVAFAQVRAGKDMSLHGYQTEDGILPKPTRLNAATLDAQVDEWRHILTQLAEDFHSGDLRVRPKNYPTTCEHCAQRILCRLDLTILHTDPNADAEAEEDHA